MPDHDVSERDAAVGVGVDATVDGLDEIGARPRQLGPDDVEQVSDDDLSVAAGVEESAQLFELVVAQLNTEVDQIPLQRLTRDLPRRTASAVHLHRIRSRPASAENILAHRVCATYGCAGNVTDLMIITTIHSGMCLLKSVDTDRRIYASWLRVPSYNKKLSYR